MGINGFGLQMTTRKEHIEWCKERAMEYLNERSQYYSVKRFVEVRRIMGGLPQRLGFEPKISGMCPGTANNWHGGYVRLHTKPMFGSKEWKIAIFND